MKMNFTRCLRLVVFLTLLVSHKLLFSSNETVLYCVSVLENHSNSQQNTNNFILYEEELLQELKNARRPFQFLKNFGLFRKKNKKFIAAVLAFPFPFGIVGLHRIYLGSSPFVPIVYIGSLGGVFGVLPLIDFVAILAQPNIDEYIDNNKVFMWIK